MLKTIVVLFSLIVSPEARSQLHQEIPLSRQSFHEKIDAAQKDIYAAFLKTASNNNAKGTEPIPPELSFAIFNKVDEIEKYIETQPSIDSIEKIAFLNGLQEVLRSFEYYYKSKELEPVQITELTVAYDKAIKLDMVDSSIFPLIKESGVEIGVMLINCSAFKTNIGINKSKEFVVLKVYEKTPKLILPVLFDNADVSLADSLIKLTAQTQPEQLYIFAQAKQSPLGIRIHDCNDAVVKIISNLANLDEGRLYFPFLDNLVTGKITISEIKNTFDEKNKVQYYKLLVKTQIGYAERLNRNETIIASNSLMNMIRRQAVKEFIDVLNELHEEPDPIRLKVLKKLNAQDLYYLCITGENELYTSSYLKIYHRIFQKKPHRYDLLQTVNYDHFKRFIKMAGNFNTLSDFLNRLDKENADSLMRSFVKGMEGPNGLEDAVDVADSYASLPGIRLRSLILSEVQKNLNRLTQNGNKIGSTIYSLLNTLFLSMDTAKNIDISSSLGIPPVYQLNNRILQNHSGKIIVQQFFYGDKDGKTEFSNFINAFRKPNWKISWKKDWVELQSLKGTSIVIYSNKPLDDETFLDIQAQKKLGEYLKENILLPTIVIHRGHSYYVQSTISQLSPTAKLVLLGSCGGYSNLSQVIKTCPNVHIIATKQLGSGSVNQPLIYYLAERLRLGKDLNWPGIWKVLEKKFKANERFADYIPPHKNLGAIFIMAYDKEMNNQLM
ncbi:MAG: hypothetical protein JWQ09_4308 [Segetibacter sp.]|nr:hypothetical protein [Segetibacter sp.]